MTGQIATFYSYKGGVGRSFLLANVAALLAKWGFRVLCVDWDIEAPGLDTYFLPWMRENDHPGLVDLVRDFRAGETVEWRRYCTQFTLPGSPQALSVITSGRPGRDYVSRLQDIDWRRLYDDLGFGGFLEEVREGWKAEYDLVLVDSRTGLTDIGGICTVHLPDLLVPVFTANEQSLGGVLKVVAQASDRRDRLPLNRAGLLVLPVASRFDARVQDQLAKEWLARFADSFEAYYNPWLDQEITPRRMIELTRIPYMSVWSFGERLAVLEERDTDPESISYYFATVAALIARRLAGTDIINTHGRDGYVEAARLGAIPSERSGHYEFYISYTSELTERARELARLLKSRGTSVFIDSDVGVGERVAEKVEHALQHSRNLVVLTAGALTTWQSFELGVAAARHAAGGADGLRIMALSFGDAAPASLADLVWIDARGLSAADIVARLGFVGDAGSRSGEDEFLALAQEYRSIRIKDYGARVRQKDFLATKMSEHALQRGISRAELAAGDDALIVALAFMVTGAPQAGDLALLLEAAPAVTSLHVAYHVLGAIGAAIARERVTSDDRPRLELVLDGYEKMAAKRADAPLEVLVQTTRRRLVNLA